MHQLARHFLDGKLGGAGGRCRLRTARRRLPSARRVCLVEPLEQRRMLTVEISVNDIQVDEDAGTAQFTVSLSESSSSTITVDAATSNGTARTADGDYTYAYDGNAIVLSGDGDGGITNRYLLGPAVDQILAGLACVSLFTVALIRCRRPHELGSWGAARDAWPVRLTVECLHVDRRAVSFGGEVGAVDRRDGVGGQAAVALERVRRRRSCGRRPRSPAGSR